MIAKHVWSSQREYFIDCQAIWFIWVVGGKSEVSLCCWVIYCTLHVSTLWSYLTHVFKIVCYWAGVKVSRSGNNSGWVYHSCCFANSNPSERQWMSLKLIDLLNALQVLLFALSLILTFLCPCHTFSSLWTSFHRVHLKGSGDISMLVESREPPQPVLPWCPQSLLPKERVSVKAFLYQKF